jgi:large subunit ribosomal protein L15
MKLHSLKSLSGKGSQRIGRGGKRGTTSGRGQKGQKSRSGHRIRPAERDLILKIPKMRGFRNKPKKDKVTVFNLNTLESHLKTYAGNGALAVTTELLKTAGLLGKNFKGEVKILGNGEISFPISVAGRVTLSQSAKEKIGKVK